MAPTEFAKTPVSIQVLDREEAELLSNDMGSLLDDFEPDRDFGHFVSVSNFAGNARNYGHTVAREYKSR
jgi:hypothetical protein